MLRLQKKRILISLLFVLIILIVGIISFVKYGSYNQKNIFSDISECYALDDLKVDDKPLVDKYIRDLPYINSYTYKLNYDSHVFKIYAYEFENMEDAKKYYLAVKGHTAEREYEYNMSGGTFGTELIVRNGANIYRIDAGGAFAYTDIMRHLNSIFTVIIHE